MPVTKTPLQPNLFEIEELIDDGEQESTRLQREESLAKALLERMLKDQAPEEGGVPPWMDAYLLLRGQGWSFRKAAYIAWAAIPKSRRWPATQEQLAVEILGLTSDRVITTWRHKNPMIDEAVNALMVAELYEARSDVFAALKESASRSDYKSHQDRKLFLEMTGDHIPFVQLRQLLLSGKLKLNKDPEDYSSEELDAIASALGPEAVALLKIDGVDDDIVGTE